MGRLIKPLTPREIYDALTGGQGTPMLEEARLAVRTQAVTQGVRAALIAKQADLLQTGWTGSASDAASNAVRPLIDNAHTASDQLLEAQALMDQQSGSFHHATNSVRPISAEPPQMDIADTLWPYVDYERQVTAWQADAQHNIDVFRGYDTASERNQNGMRTYSTVDDSGGTVGVTDTGDHLEVPDGEQPRDGGQPRDGSQPRDGGQPEPYGERRDPGSGPGSVPVGGSPVGGPAPGGQQPQQTSPSDFVPRPAAPLPGGQLTPTGPGPGGFVQEPPTGGLIAGGGPYGMRGPGLGSGPGEPGPGGRGPGAGMRGGPGAGALAAAEEAAARRAAAAATRGAGAGVMGGTPVGAGRGRDEEDRKHQRKVLLEADAEGLFGSDVLTAPQVIGDDAYEDD